MVTDGVDLYVVAGDLLGPSGNGSGYAPQIDVWPSISFNTDPTATDASISTSEDTPVQVTLSGSDVDGDSITFAIAFQPANGSLGPITVVDASSATVAYTPSTDFNGIDTFTYVVNDGHVDSAAATVTVNVEAVATPTPTPIPTAAPTPAPTSTPDPNIVHAPSTSGWSLAALVAGMLMVLLVFLAKSRPRTQAT